MISRSRALRGAALFIFVGTLLGFVVGQAVRVQLEPLRIGAAGESTWLRLAEARRLIASRYVKPVQDGALMDGALRGMVSALNDPHSAYFDAKQYTDYLAHFNDTFIGIGVTLEMGTDKKLVIIKPLHGSPAERAGLRAGDKIVAVNGQSVVGMLLDEVVLQVRGDPGTSVRLTIERGVQAPFDVNVTRAALSMPLEEHRLLSDGIGYIQLYEFNTHAARRMSEAIDNLKKEKMRALILDLRQNPGGLLSEAVDIASQLVPEGPVLFVVDRDGTRKTYESHSKGLGMPLVVLVDRGSASAAEVVAGAVKDRRAGTLLGERTYGKGSVQQFFDLPGGAGIKLTIQKYMTAGNISIDGVGIEPDLVVPMPDKDANGQNIDLGSANDVQLQRALTLLKG